MEVRMVVTLQGDSLNESAHNVRYTAWDSLSLQTFHNSFISLDNAKAVSKLPLELDPNNSITVFEMTYHGQVDTLYVEHTPRQYFVSLACGCAVYHTITHAWTTDQRVDSIQIINANVENAVQENLRIHIHE